MKKNIFTAGMLVLILLFGVMLIGWDSGSLEGTNWGGDWMRTICFSEDSEWTYWAPFSTRIASGTYSLDENTIIFTQTWKMSSQFYDALWRSSNVKGIISGDTLTLEGDASTPLIFSRE
jgi:hypothetical protein